MIKELILVYKIMKFHKKIYRDRVFEIQKEQMDERISDYRTAKANYIKSPYPRRPNYVHDVYDKMAEVIIESINCLQYPAFYGYIKDKHSKKEEEEK